MEIFILRDGEQTGPFNEDTVQTLFQRGSLTSADMAWRKGLPAWTPLGEVLHPGSERPSAPPPVVQSGIRQAPGKKSAGAKQKALLKYIGATFAEEITREEAALMISDAMENPKLTSRLQKWTEEKLKLHPDLFQEELDQRRSHRVLRYLERCQTEAGEAVKDVTKAHVQVLVESLDKRTATWEHDPKAALWDHLLPAIAEHFPQLVREGWKGKLKAGGGSKVADAMVESGELTEGPEAPSTMMAVVRGLVFGGLALALFFGIRHLTTTGTGTGKSGTPATGQNAKAPATPPVDANATANSAPNGSAPTHPTNAPLIAANPADNVPAPTPNAEANAAVPDVNAVPATPANPPAAPAPAETPAPAPAANAPAADPNMAANNPPAAPAPGVPANPATALGTPPAPAPPGTEAPAAPAANVPPAPAETPAAAGFKNILSIVKPVKVQLQFGVVTLNVGTRVRFIALEGQNVRVNFNNNIILVPAIATDVDPNAIPPAPVVAPPSAPPAVPVPAPATATAPKPAVPATPKPSSDL